MVRSPAGNFPSGMNMLRSSSNSNSLGADSPSEYMLCQPGEWPSLASDTAGATTSASGSLPSSLCASQSPATAPGTAMDRGPSRFSSPTTPAHPKLPTEVSPDSSYMSGRAASGPFIGNPTTPPRSPTW